MENQESKAVEEQVLSGFEWAARNVCRKLFSKDVLARACGVSKSAIETQFRTIARTAFPPQEDGTPATPDTLKDRGKAVRHEMLVIAVVLRFSGGGAPPTVPILDRISHIRAMTVEEMVPVIEAATIAAKGAKENKLEMNEEHIVAMDASPSLKRLAMILGQSTSAMTARAKKMRRDNESLTDSEIVDKIWFEGLRHKLTDLPISESMKMHEDRRSYMSFIHELSELCTVESEVYRIKSLMMCYVDSMAGQIRFDIAEGILSAEPSTDIESVVFRVVSSVFEKHGIGSTNVDRIVEAYVQNVTGRPSQYSICNSVEQAIDQHAVWEMFIKSLDGCALNDLFAETGRPRNGRGCSAMHKFAPDKRRKLATV